MDAAVKRCARAVRSWPCRLPLALVASAGALALVLAASASASSARYIYEVCDSALPGGGVPAGLKFTVNPGVPLSPAQNCAQPGGSIAINQTGPVTATYSFWEIPIAAAPGGEIETYVASGAACGGTGTVAFFYSRGWPSLACQDEQHLIHAGGGLDLGALLWLGCDGNSGTCPAGPHDYVHYIAATEVDPVAPTLAKLQGSLLGGGVIRGHQTLGADAHDEGGGLTSVSALVNGLPAAAAKVLSCNTIQADNPSVKGTVAATVTPCPNDTTVGWTLDTQVPPFHDGANAVQVCASDFATIGDPNTTCTPPQSVNVDNSCTPSPVPGGELLSAQFSRSNTDTLTVPFGETAEVTGRLADNAGDPISGATLCVKLQTLGVERHAATVGAVQTDANGGYAYRVPAGPNRDVIIGYRHDASQVARDLRYYAHARPSLRSSPGRLRNGERVHFWGQLPGPRRAGRVVVLQANIVGSKRWITFRKATANNKGVFRAAYHFTSTTRATSYRFRAVVPNQAGYPWVQGHSKPVLVRVRP